MANPLLGLVPSPLNPPAITSGKLYYIRIIPGVGGSNSLTPGVNTIPPKHIKWILHVILCALFSTPSVLNPAEVMPAGQERKMVREEN